MPNHASGRLWAFIDQIRDSVAVPSRGVQALCPVSVALKPGANGANQSLCAAWTWSPSAFTWLPDCGFVYGFCDDQYQLAPLKYCCSEVHVWFVSSEMRNSLVPTAAAMSRTCVPVYFRLSRIIASGCAEKSFANAGSPA